MPKIIQKKPLREINNPISSHLSGFTLVELALVLVIIGLLAGGVTAGIYLIQAAKVRAVITEVNKFKTALSLFNDKYSGLPGDITNATTLWPSASPATTDGDGDGRISFTEGYAAWQQLSLASMITGIYDGTTTPLSQMETGQYGLEYSSSAAWANGISGNFIIFYQKGSTPTSGTYAAAIAPVDAASIDGSLDDGFPSTGQVGNVVNAATPCTLGTSPNLTYNAQYSTIACALLFKFSD